MKQFTYTINDSQGIHARPAGLLAKLSTTYSSEIKIAKNGNFANAKKIFAVMGLAAKQGDAIVVTVEGDDEVKAEEGLHTFFKANL